MIAGKWITADRRGAHRTFGPYDGQWAATASTAESEKVSRAQRRVPKEGTGPIGGWAGRAIERIGFEADTWRLSRTLGSHLMEYVIIFLLFFAVLAAAWFYLMRAKNRPVDSGVATDAAADDH